MPKLDPSILPAVPRYPKKMTKLEIFKLLRKYDPLILEIGCNDGQDTAEFLAKFLLAKIHCFECDPRPIAKFKTQITDARAKLHEIALADKNGTMMLHQSGGTTNGADRPDWDMSSSLLLPKEHLVIHPWCTFEKTIEVPTMRLDDWADQYIVDRTVDFVWLDVQGAEKLVFAGGRRTLLERTRFVYAEFAVTEEYEGCWLVNDLVAAFDGFVPLGIYEGYNILLARRGL